MIKIESISKSFGSFYALRDISLEINPGEFWIIVGPNGAGKTTLLKIIATLSHPSQGKILINGTISDQDRLKIRKQIGFIGHQSFLYDNLTAEENLKFYARMYQLADTKRRINEILKQVGLGARKDDFVRNFSRGMQQRLSIARALLTDPKIVLLDEPFSGLDQSAIDNFVELFTSLVSPERIIIMTTHNLQLGLQLSSHFAIISKGKIVQQASTNGLDIHQFKKLYLELTEKSN
jgi:heme exporter protein A